MIRIYILKKIIIVRNNEYEYAVSCPYCYAEIKWDVDGQMSPWHCPKCKTEMPDFSKIEFMWEWRYVYHMEGMKSVECRNTVKCVNSSPI